jgi:hypothetical protein
MKYITLLIICVAVLSCKKDNYDAPSVTLQGRITYQGEPINVSSKDVTFELWEPGWGKNGAIVVNVNEDGTYSALLFNGSYKLVIPPSQGPFRSITNNETNSDTMLFKLSGSKTMDIEVMPYYMVRNAAFSLNGTNLVDANFKLEKIITDANGRNIENVFLYLNQTSFVDGTNYIARTSIAGADITDLNNISMQVTVPAVISANGTTGDQDYVYARIGVKISGVEDILFSPVEKIDL